MKALNELTYLIPITIVEEFTFSTVFLDRRNTSSQINPFWRGGQREGDIIVSANEILHQQKLPLQDKKCLKMLGQNKTTNLDNSSIKPTFVTSICWRSGVSRRMKI